MTTEPTSPSAPFSTPATEHDRQRVRALVASLRLRSVVAENGKYLVLGGSLGAAVVLGQGKVALAALLASTAVVTFVWGQLNRRLIASFLLHWRLDGFSRERSLQLYRRYRRT